MKLSIVIICWNDRKVISDCLRSIYAETKHIQFEVIISDNGSADDSLAFIRQNYPQVRVVENFANLGFAKGNNAGIRVATGEYVLILNPDTIVHGDSLDQWIAFADKHPDAGAFGCRVLNKDGTYQNPARPFPTVGRYLITALGLRPLGYVSKMFLSDTYVGWAGESERQIDWQSGCCVLMRRNLLREIGGFDERFFYHFEEVDLCRRIWNSGKTILHCPQATITHLGGQSVGRFPIRFAIEKFRNRYRYIYKHFGSRAVLRCRAVALINLRIRQAGYGLLRLIRPTESLRNRMEMYRVVIRWNKLLNANRFIQTGQEPDVGYEPLAPAPDMTVAPSAVLQS